MSRERQAQFRDGSSRSFLVAAGAEIEENANVVLNADGFAIPAIAGPDVKSVGSATEPAKGGETDGEARVECRTGIKLWRNSEGDPVSAAQIGEQAFIQDQNTVSATDAAGSLSPAGEVFDVDAAGVWIKV